ncbi:MAG TPA: nucleotide sugar dehydrogenase [Candidatus Acidoferrum sp.]
MRVSVFGLGYVGLVSAACLARDGHTVIGTDAEPRRMALAGVGRFPILEPALNRLIDEAAGSGRFRTTADPRSAVLDTDVSLICVGATSNANGSLNLQDLDAVCMQIGAALAIKEDYHLVVVRTTVLPGTIEGRLTLLLEQHSDRQAGNHFGICMNPLLLSDWSGRPDFDHSNPIVIGELDARSGDTARRLYQATHAPVVRTSLQTAEMLSYVNNAFHAVKVTFANEIGNLCAAHGIDGHELMEHFCLGECVNISAAYLRPGFAFGGSCLPKDLRALVYRAKEQDVDCPLLSAVLLSNKSQVSHAIELVEKTRRSRVGILGLGIKAGPADIGENPIVHLAEILIGKGYKVKIFDENVDWARPNDTTTFFLDRGLPHIAKVISPSLQDVIAESEVVVIANGDNAVRNVPRLLSGDQILIDLAGVTRSAATYLPKAPLSLRDGKPHEDICK